jgi:hypothetical protein
MTSIKETPKLLICVICDQPIADDRHGNSAEPVAEGECCTACNVEVVLPYRIIQAKNTTCIVLLSFVTYVNKIMEAI